MNPSFCCLGNAHGGWQNNDIQQPHQLAAAVLPAVACCKWVTLFFPLSFAAISGKSELSAAMDGPHTDLFWSDARKYRS